MIVYQTNTHFWRDIAHLTRSWTMRRILRGAGGVALFTAAFCVVFTEVWPSRFLFPSGVFSLLGIVMSVLLVFRTNTAYDRWYEGRTLWGGLVNNSRNLAVGLHTALPPDDRRTRQAVAVLLANFAIALKEHLRQGIVWHELLHLTPAETAAYQARPHLPNHIASLIHGQVQQAYRGGALTGTDLRNLKPHLQAFMDVTGACERIKKTPIPFSYSVYVKLLILGYSLMLPFGLIGDFGYFTIPMVTFIFFAFIGVEMMASEIEDPFGRDCNDLPTGDIARTIHDNVFDLLDVASPDAVPSAAPAETYAKIF